MPRVRAPHGRNSLTRLLEIHRSAVELFPYSEGGRDGAGGPVLPRRRSRGNLAVACFTRNAFSLAGNYET